MRTLEEVIFKPIVISATGIIPTYCDTALPRIRTVEHVF
jgi:hypothetical protein